MKRSHAYRRSYVAAELMELAARLGGSASGSVRYMPRSKAFERSRKSVMDKYGVFELPAPVSARTILAMAAAPTYATRSSTRRGALMTAEKSLEVFDVVLNHLASEDAL
jgi:hypothetical protein